jgi:thiamine-phosphate pyrophosphorylase
VWVREKASPPRERRALVERLAAIVRAAGACLVASPGPGSDLADAYQLGAGATVPEDGKPFGRSCHDMAELDRAVREGCSWATVSPVFVSASKPGYGPALGLGGLAAMVAAVQPAPGAPADRPAPGVLALGGVTSANAAHCLGAGASGVVVMGAVMAAADVAVEVERILACLEVAV